MHSISSSLLRTVAVRRAPTRAAARLSTVAMCEPAKEEESGGAPYDSLDLRVGRIVKAWRHPEAEKLFVEEVDVGEAEPRQVGARCTRRRVLRTRAPRELTAAPQICSGLVGYVPDESLQDRLVVVLCNLKARNMRGVKSFGMLLAASDEKHEKVELLSPPAGATVGERVRFGDAPQTGPDSENKVQKKKIWEGVQPELLTTATGAAAYKELPMLTSAGPVTVATLFNGHIS